MTIDKKSWGFRRNMAMEDVFSIEELLKELAVTVSCGGNLLMNVGPNKDGIIVPIFEERLRQMGQWLEVNGEAIYGTSPWKYQNDTTNADVWYTSKLTEENGKVVYGVLLEWPESGTVEVNSPEAGPGTEVTVTNHANMVIKLPDISNTDLKWSWVLKFVNL